MSSNKATIEFPIFVMEEMDYYKVHEFAAFLRKQTGIDHVIHHFQPGDDNLNSAVIFLNQAQMDSYLSVNRMKTPNF